jgi:hypothetical protein
MNRMIWLVVLALAACSDDPVNVAGDYSVNITNGANGCNLQNWTVGDSSTGIPVTITQGTNKADATAVINGATGVYVNAVIGGMAFQGNVDGADLDAVLHGTRAYTMGGCTYTFTVDLSSSLNKDTLSGQLTYTPATNHGADCGILETCSSVQQFNGLRAPK